MSIQTETALCGDSSGNKWRHNDRRLKCSTGLLSPSLHGEKWRIAFNTEQSVTIATCIKVMVKISKYDQWKL